MEVAKVAAVASLGVGLPDYAGSQQIIGQATGLANTPDYQTQLGNQKQLALQATNLNTQALDNIYARYYASASYTVAADKDFYIWILSALISYATTTSIYNWIVEIYDNTTGVRIYAIAGTGIGSSNLQFSQPLKILRGHQILLTFYNYGTPGIGGNTIGYSTVAASPLASQVGNHLLTAYCRYAALYTWYISNIIVYGWSSVPGSLIAALYSDNAGVPGNVLVQSAVIAIPSGYYWCTGPVAVTGINAGTYYWLAATVTNTNFNPAQSNTFFYHDAGATGNFLYYRYLYTNPFVNNPAGLTAVGIRKMTIYATPDLVAASDYNQVDARIIGYEL